MTYHIPASFKGCCFNPKGWCIGAPHHPFSMEDPGMYVYFKYKYKYVNINIYIFIHVQKTLSTMHPNALKESLVLSLMIQ